MPLTLEVIGDKAARMGRAARKTFTAGGTIGRLPDNDWVFPDQYISGHHARIAFANGAFTIEDTSTNGVFINSPQNRLTRKKPHPLRNGDTIFIDDYEVRVTVAAESAAAERYAPARSAPPSESLIPDDSFDGLPGASGVPNATDPLALLGLQSSPAIPAGPSAASLAKQSPMAEHYRPPKPIPPARPAPPAPPAQPAAAPPKEPPPGFIPDDYDPMSAEEDDPFAEPDPTMSRPVLASPPAPPPPARPAVSPPGRAVPAPPSRTASTVMTGAPRVSKPAPRSAPFEPPTPPPQSAGHGTGRDTPAPESDDPFETVSPERPRAPPRQAAVPPPRQSATPAPPPRRQVAPPATPPAAPPAAPATRAAPTPAGSGAAPDFAALLQAAGLEGARVTPELSQQFGQILRVVVAGLMDVLRARDKIKDEFRMRMTTYKQADNNPLKFSVNVEDALHNLLVKRNAAYLGPVEAFEDAFLDVRNHQMAMLAGVRVAYEAMLAEFDPDRLQEDFDHVSKSGNFLSGGAKAKYWDLYRTRFHDMVKDADSSFRHLFGDDFAKAYEEQLSRLKAANRAERK
jgi:type VI secretion system FHA domain protein